MKVHDIVVNYFSVTYTSNCRKPSKRLSSRSKEIFGCFLNLVLKVLCSGASLLGAEIILKPFMARWPMDISEVQMIAPRYYKLNGRLSRINGVFFEYHLMTGESLIRNVQLRTHCSLKFEWCGLASSQAFYLFVKWSKIWVITSCNV